MTNLPDSVPTQIKVSFFEHKRKEWVKVLESSQSIPSGANQSDSLQHWTTINNYALAKIQEIDAQLAKLKSVYNIGLATPLNTPIYHPSKQ
jgi:hypothetical protein